VGAAQDAPATGEASLHGIWLTAHRMLTPARDRDIPSAAKPADQRKRPHWSGHAGHETLADADRGMTSACPQALLAPAAGWHLPRAYASQRREPVPGQQRAQPRVAKVPPGSMGGRRRWLPPHAQGGCEAVRPEPATSSRGFHRARLRRQLERSQATGSSVFPPPGRAESALRRHRPGRSWRPQPNRVAVVDVDACRYSASSTVEQAHECCTVR
jgi:hypothetical protein